MGVMSKKTPTVIAPFFNRSESGPLQPLCDVAKRHQDELQFDMLDCTSLKTSDVVCAELTKLLKERKPSMVLCAFDRPLMALTAFIAYHMRLPICQIFAGDYAGGSFDDADRFCISNYAELLFCADKPQYMRARRALDWCAGKERKEISISGATHFDGMRYIDPGLREYVLVLYNPSLYLGRSNLEKELENIKRILEKNKKEIIWVSPNGDPGSNLVERTARSMENVTYLEDMPRDRFLGLVRYADEFIGNSSCQFYEAPYFGTRSIQVGYRNMYREPISKEMCKPGASKIIIEKMIKHFKETD
jgi:UDP-N-acetylglucosamine 2-epimerase